MDEKTIRVSKEAFKRLSQVREAVGASFRFQIDELLNIEEDQPFPNFFGASIKSAIKTGEKNARKRVNR